jgi:hypothetical protein
MFVDCLRTDAAVVDADAVWFSYHTGAESADLHESV